LCDGVAVVSGLALLFFELAPDPAPVVLVVAAVVFDPASVLAERVTAVAFRLVPIAAAHALAAFVLPVSVAGHGSAGSFPPMTWR
jgi:hypothetical protein